MSWVTVAVAGAGALKGGLDARAARSKQKAHDKFRRQAIRMSPWTGMGDPGAGNFGNQSLFSGALGGGLQGALIGSAFRPSGAAGGAGTQLTGDASTVNPLQQQNLMNTMQPQNQIMNNVNGGGWQALQNRSYLS